MKHNREINIVYLDKHLFIDRVANHLNKFVKVNWISIDDFSPSLRFGKNAVENIVLDRIHEDQRFFTELAVFKRLQESGLAIINNPDSYGIGRNKILFYLWAIQFGIPIPKTYLINKLADYTELSKKRQRHIIKPPMGFSGLGIVELTNSDYAEAEFYNSVKQFGFAIVQEYLENEKSIDLRFDMVGEQVADFYFRIAPSSGTRNLSICNISQGGTILNGSPPARALEIAKEIMRKLKLDYAGIDIIEDSNGEFKVLEVNPEPGIEKSQFDFASTTAEHLLKRFFGSP